MGYIHMPWVFGLEGLNQNEKLVLMCLVHHADNEKRETWVSVSRITTECGYAASSVKTVRRSLQSLRGKGLIDYKGRTRKDGSGQSSNLYTVHWGSTPRADSPTPLGSTAPGVGAENPTNKEVNQPVPDRESVSRAIEDSSPMFHGLHGQSPIPRDKAAEADPISPEFYGSDIRQQLLAQVQAIAWNMEHGKQIEAADESDELYVMLEETFGVSLDEMLDRGWATPPKKCVDKLNAAIWLNKLLATFQVEAHALEWAPDEDQK
ncbi:helix-turn-helix domain-containing protein [Zhihengliuella halotolerans]|uniref:helix-turn-helix domain-containing protein n=1 Tax=Zhihengliuella halotolerans TaxID=370736 RepID=UPI000C804158|nr:helix-turn-helix domain-containing protein [Zhihengliuella halotolerans]